MTLQTSMAKLLSRKCICLFYVIWLISSLDFLNACEYEKNRTCNSYQKTVQGDSLNMPLNDLGPILDVCFWNSSVSKWVSTCQFKETKSEEICEPLIHDFNMNISVENKTLFMSNMTVENNGDYRILDVSKKCLEITVSVSDSRSRNSGNSNVSSWILILLVPVLVLVCCCV